MEYNAPEIFVGFVIKVAVRVLDNISTPYFQLTSHTVGWRGERDASSETPLTIIL